MSTAKDLFDSAKNLPESERAALAAWLIDTLDSSVDEDAQPAWDAEIQQRIQQLDEGKVSLVPWTEARKMILGTIDGPITN